MPFMQLPTHALLHRPQCIESVASVTSHPSPGIPLQSANPALHADRPHTMSRQSREALATAGQGWPQPPQLSGSYRGSAHDAPPSQATIGSAHAGPHVLIEQTEVALQGMPHAPQWALSLAMVTHCPKQSVWPTAQLSAQPPPTQRCPGSHAIPQPPQLKTSVLVSTQPGPHIVVPDGQPPAQVPPWHSRPGGHIIPHPPQFAGSNRGSTQPGPHVSSGGAQPEVTGTHVASTQPPTAQSRLRVHAAPSGQGAHVGPPQSTSLSRPLAS